MSFLRRLKLSYIVNNLMHKKVLDCNAAIYKKMGIQKSVIQLISSQDLPETTENLSPWLDRKNGDIESNLEYSSMDKNLQSTLRDWSKNGYAILPKFYSHTEVEQINKEIEILLENQTAKKRLDERVIFAIHDSAIIYNLANRTDLNNILSFILGKKVKLFQSLNFKKGSAQLAHSDTIHMTTYPLGYMIAVWIALEDIDAASGPLFYYPGSHKLPYVLNNNYPHGGNYFLHGMDAYKKYESAIQEIIVTNALKKEIFLAKKGDVFIWHANILHGGEPIQNPKLTRKSMVLHFYAEEVICYHEITQRPAIFGGKEAACAVIESEK
jgi:ectoine hydroxylase